MNALIAVGLLIGVISICFLEFEERKPLIGTTFILAAVLCITGLFSLDTDKINNEPQIVATKTVEVEVLISGWRYKSGYWVTYKHNNQTRETVVPCSEIPLGKFLVNENKLRYPGNIIKNEIDPKTFCATIRPS